MGTLNTGGTKTLTATTGKTSIIYTTGTPTYITITFDRNDLSTITYTKAVLAGIEKVTPPSPSPTRTGFTLTGWSETPSGTTPVEFPVVLSATKTYYAIWEALEYVTATFNLNGGSGTFNPISGYEPLALNISEEPTKIGYNFIGWLPSLPPTITADQTFIAQWSAKQTTITFNPATGNGVTNTTATYGVSMPTSGWYTDEFGDPVPVGSMTAPTQIGYNFNGYQDSFNVLYYNTPMGSVKNWDKEDNSITLYAKWVIINYTITYNLNGGINNLSNPATYTYNSSTITFQAPTREGYNFLGWYTTENFTAGTETTGIPTNSTGNKTIYAKWEAKTYSISYVLNDLLDFSGAYPATLHALTPTSYTTGSTVSLFSPWRSTYTFSGWYDNQYFNGSAITSFIDADGGNRTFWAKWTPSISYTISPNKTTVGELAGDNTVIFSVTSTHSIENTLYWRILGQSGIITTSDFKYFNGYFDMINPINATKSGSFTVELTEDDTTELTNETFKVELLTGSISGTTVKTSDLIQITDTSKTTTATPSISITATSYDTITFKLINNEQSSSVTIWYAANSSPNTSGNLKLSNVSPGVLNGQTAAINGLSEGTTYNLYAQALIDQNYNYSAISSPVSATTTCRPSGIFIGYTCNVYEKRALYTDGTCGSNSTHVEYNSFYCGYVYPPTTSPYSTTSSTVQFSITNSDPQGAYIYWKIRSGSVSGTILIDTYLYVNSGQTIYPSYNSASISQRYFLTDVKAVIGSYQSTTVNGIAAKSMIPTVAVGSKTDSSVEFTIKNEDGIQAAIPWNIRNSSSTILANGTLTLNPGETKTVGYYNASPNTAYSLTNVYSQVLYKSYSYEASSISSTTYIKVTFSNSYTFVPVQYSSSNTVIGTPPLYYGAPSPSPTKLGFGFSSWTPSISSPAYSNIIHTPIWYNSISLITSSLFSNASYAFQDNQNYASSSTVTEGAYISFDNPNIATLRVVGSGYVSYEYWDSESESYVDTVSSLRVRLQYNDGGIWKNENSVSFTQAGTDTTLYLGQITMDKNLRLVTSPTYISDPTEIYEIVLQIKLIAKVY